MLSDQPGGTMHGDTGWHNGDPSPSGGAAATGCAALTRREMVEALLGDPATRAALERAAAEAGLSRVEDLTTRSLAGQPVTPPGPLPPEPTYEDYSWEAGIDFPAYSPGPVYHRPDGARHCLGSIYGTGIPNFSVFRTRWMLERGWALLGGYARGLQATLSMDLHVPQAGLFSIMVEVSPWYPGLPPGEFPAAFLRTFYLCLYDARHISSPMEIRFSPAYNNSGETVMLFAQAHISPLPDQQAQPLEQVDLNPLRQTCRLILTCQPGQEGQHIELYLHRVLMTRL